MTKKKQERELPPFITLEDFYAFMPKHEYIFAPLPDKLWPAASVNARLPRVPLLAPDGTVIVDENGNAKLLKPSTWLDQNHAVEAMTWAPGEPEVISGRLPSKSGWIERADVRTFNTYHPSAPWRGGRASGAKRWQELLEKLYPDDAGHLTACCAHCVQRPGVKINHGVVLAGAPGIGKDTLLEPLRRGVGAANFAETSPHAIMKGDYNDYLCAVVLRISEARDQGEVNRYALYEKMKTMLAAPPDMHRINTKYIPQYYAANVVCIFITTNYAFDGLFLPSDDRRHYVAATEVTAADFTRGFFDEHYAWYANGGLEDVVAYLAEYDLTRFNPKVTPKKTDDILDHGRRWHGAGSQRAERCHRSARPSRNAASDAQRRRAMRAGGVDASDAAGPDRDRRE